MIMSMMVMVGNELSCIDNCLGGIPNVGLVGGTSPSPKGLGE
jgi:hypothetical protein